MKGFPLFHPPLVIVVINVLAGTAKVFKLRNSSKTQNQKGVPKHLLPERRGVESGVREIENDTVIDCP
jgi:hypothetical protein